MIKKWRLALTTCMIVALTLQSGSSVFAQPISSSSQQNEVMEILKQYGDLEDGQLKEVSQNKDYTMYINDKTTEIYIKDKNSSRIWSSNPINKNEDNIAASLSKDLLNSQLIIRHSNDKGQISEKNTYSDSIKNSQFKMEKVDNGIKVNYILGIAEKVYVAPKIISQKNFEEKIEKKINDENKLKIIKRRYQEINLDKIKTDTEKKRYLELYPSLEQHKSIYVLKQSSDFQLEELQELLIELGYDIDEMNVDHRENNVPEEEKSKEVFEISIIYKLDNNGLSVEVPLKDLKYDSGFPVTEIVVLPFMGAVDMNTNDAFVFVPDGSGGIIKLEDKHNLQGKYVTKVYGNDKGILQKEKFSRDLNTVMPVFGIQTNDQGIFAIIEEGQSYGSIEVNLAGRTNIYNTVAPTFTVLSQDYLDIKNLAADKVVKVYQERPYEGSYKMRYMFYKPEKKSYMDMVNIYQKYLENIGDLNEKTNDSKTYFISEVIGAVDKIKRVLGVPINTKEPLTKFEESKQILKELLDNGVKNIKLRYTGMTEGGIYAEELGNLDIERSVGSKKDFNDLKNFADENDVEFMPEIETQYLKINNNKIFDNFRESKDASRFINDEIAYNYNYNIATYKNNIKSASYIANKNNLSKTLKKLRKGLDMKNISSISLGSLGKDVNSDFNAKHFIDRQEMVSFIENEFKNYNEKDIKIMVDGGNSYVLPYVDTIVNIPLKSNSQSIVDYNIPFYQLVLHGYVTYAGEPINLSDDVQKSKLKTVETGSAIYYKWFYADLAAIKDTEVSYLFSGSYDKWKNDAIDFYKRVDNELGDTYNQKIINHRGVELGVYEVTYEKGKKVIVNYNDYEVSIDSQIVKPLDFLVIEGVK